MMTSNKVMLELDYQRFIKEKDLEEWLFHNPQALHHYMGPVNKWVARQFKVPNGVIDLLGVSGNNFIVVELKKVDIDSSALAQVCRYAYDIENILHNVDPYCDHHVYKYVIGKDISNQCLTEADALGVSTMSYQVSLDIELSGAYSFTREYREARNTQYAELAKRQFFQDVIDEDAAKEQESIIDEALRVMNEDEKDLD